MQPLDSHLPLLKSMRRSRSLASGKSMAARKKSIIYRREVPGNDDDGAAESKVRDLTYRENRPFSIRHGRSSNSGMPVHWLCDCNCNIGLRT